MNLTDNFFKVVASSFALLFIAVFILGKMNRQTVRYLSGFNSLISFLAVVLFVVNILVAVTSADNALFAVVIITEALICFVSMYVFSMRAKTPFLKFLTYFVFAFHFLIVLLFIIFLFTFKITRIF